MGVICCTSFDAEIQTETYLLIAPYEKKSPFYGLRWFLALQLIPKR